MHRLNGRHLSLRAVLLFELRSESNVLLLGLVLPHPLLTLPSVPLGLALEVQHAWPDHRR